jgi:hypothetical protein
MDAKPSNEDVVDAALDTLLQVVDKSADDLRNFHEALTKLRVERPTPFPRIVVATAESIIEHLTKVEEQLRKVTVAAGL